MYRLVIKSVNVDNNAVFCKILVSLLSLLLLFPFLCSLFSCSSFLSFPLCLSLFLVGSLTQTSQLTRGWVDPEASLVLLHSPVRLVVLTSISFPCTSARTQGVVESWKHDLGEKTEFYYGLFYVLLWYILDLITFTKLNYLRVRHVRWDSGEWRAWSKPWKGRVNFAPGLGGKHTSRKGSIRVFWGFRSSASPNCKVNSLVWSFRWKLPAANATKAGWSWPEMLKGSTSSCTATVVDTTSPKELSWTQFMKGTRATYTDCKDEREASRRLNSSGLCRSSR